MGFGMTSSPFDRNLHTESFLAGHPWDPDDARLASLADSTLGIEALALFDDEIQGIAQWAGSVSMPARGGGAAWMDATTLFTAQRLLTDRDEILSPATVMDLSTFVDAVCLYQRVYYLSSPDVDPETLNDWTGDTVFVPLPRPGPADGHELAREGLARLFSKSERDYRDALESYDSAIEIAERDALLTGWSAVLGVEVTKEAIYDQHEFSLSLWSDAPSLVRQLGDVARASDSIAFGAVARDRVQPGYRRVLAEAGVRSYFNRSLASLLQLPYAPNAARMPTHLVLAQRARSLTESLATLRAVESTFRARAVEVTRHLPYVLTLPFFLAALVNEADELDDLQHNLGEMRKNSARLRSHLSELDVATREGNSKHMAELRNALEDDTRLLRGVFAFNPIAGVIATALGGAGAANDPLLGVISIFMGGVSQLSEGARRKLRRRFTQPAWWFVSSMSDRATATSNQLPRLARLWRVEDEEMLAQRFERLRQLRWG